MVTVIMPESGLLIKGKPKPVLPRCARRDDSWVSVSFVGLWTDDMLSTGCSTARIEKENDNGKEKSTEIHKSQDRQGSHDYQAEVYDP